ncbi:hypothetical protein F5B21DRAFT_110106 [Xylaria acuta]|nr:hypothetical protein F5B21DRAFT_110106 [Xylaria acuta]
MGSGAMQPTTASRVIRSPLSLCATHAELLCTLTGGTQQHQPIPWEAVYRASIQSYVAAELIEKETAKTTGPRSESYGHGQIRRMTGTTRDIREYLRHRRHRIPKWNGNDAQRHTYLVLQIADCRLQRSNLWLQRGTASTCRHRVIRTNQIQYNTIQYNAIQYCAARAVDRRIDFIHARSDGTYLWCRYGSMSCIHGCPSGAARLQCIY